MRSVICVLFCIFSCSTFLKASGDSSDAFEKSYYFIATQLASNDMSKALVSADSLLTQSKSDLHRLKSLMLIATLQSSSGDILTSLSNAIKAEKIAEESKNIEWQIRISGFLSTSFRTIGLYTNGKKYLDKAADLSTSVKSPLINMFIYQEKAFYNLEENNCEEANRNIQFAENEFLKIGQQVSNPVFSATNNYVLGECKIKAGELDTAYSIFLHSLNNLDNQYGEVKGFLYMGLVDLHFLNHNLDSVKYYLNKVEEYSQSANIFYLKLKLNKAYSNYYSEVGDVDNAKKHNELYYKLIEEQNTYLKTLSNSIIKESHDKIDKDEKFISNLSISLLVLFVILILIVAYFLRMRIVERRKYNLIIADIKTQHQNALHEDISVPIEEEDTNDEDVNLDAIIEDSYEENDMIDNVEQKHSLSVPEEVEFRLLVELKKFERNDYFIHKKNLSLSSLAAKMKTNSKYLSYVIN